MATLRKETEKVIAKAQEGPQFVVENDTLQAVIISPSAYQEYIKLVDELDILEQTKKAIKENKGMSANEAIKELTLLSNEV